MFHQPNEVTRASAGGLECVREMARLPGLRAEWGRLHQHSLARIFTRWEWLYPWLRRIAPEREPFVLLVRGPEGELRGLLPLGLEIVRVAGVPVRRLAFLGETHVGSDFLDAVALEGQEVPVARELALGLAALQSQWDVLDLLDLPEGAPLLGELKEVLGPKGYSLRTSPRFVCPFEPLCPPEGFEGFLRRTARRDNYLRRRKWLERQPGYRIDRTDSPAALDEPLSTFFHLHQLRWDSEGGSSGIKGSRVRSFHRESVALLAERGLAALYTLRVEGAAVASVYALRDRGRFVYFQSGYDPAWRARSVGLVLVGATFEDAFASGLTEYDFLRGTEAYKADWTTQARRTLAFRAFAPLGRGALLDRQQSLWQAGRGLARSVLPDRWAEQLRRVRRRGAQLD